MKWEEHVGMLRELSRRREPLGEIHLNGKIQMTGMLYGFYEYCDETWGSIKGEGFFAACCCRVMKIALCRGISMALVPHRKPVTSLNRNVIALNSILLFITVFRRFASYCCPHKCYKIPCRRSSACCLRNW
jgi:hypothetical protein